jgi:transcriptional regulator with XRE-family HTH domain
MTLMDRMAKRLKDLRAARGWSQADLAARAGLSREYVARIETVRQEPTVGVIERLAKALKVKPGDLLE